jgi:16S rRNA (guanine1516-N2)-methyltransferase
MTLAHSLTVPIYCAPADETDLRDILALYCHRYGLDAVKVSPNEGYFLKLSMDGLALIDAQQPRSQIKVDWASGVARHRRLQGGGRGQAIAKAMGLKSGSVIRRIVDATAGLGGDAFVLASLGAEIVMLERSPIAAVLLHDGLARAMHSDDIELRHIAANMQLYFGEAQDGLIAYKDWAPHAVLLDPMFPHTDKKTAAAKKEMQVFQTMIGADLDADALWQPAFDLASHRVVVKRPKRAPYLAEQLPNHTQMGESTRFDIYTKRSVNKAQSDDD